MASISLAKMFPTNDGKCLHVVEKLLDVLRVLTVDMSLGDAELEPVPHRAKILLAQTQHILDRGVFRALAQFRN